MILNLLTAILGGISLAKLYAKPDDKIFLRLSDTETAIRKLIEEACSFMLSGSNVSCVHSYPDDLWPVEADPGQISQVVQNLILNAAEAMPEGGTLRVRA